MFIVGNFLAATASVLHMLLSAYMWIIIIRAVISWVDPDPYNPIVRFLYAATDPVLYRVRRWLPVYFSGIDFSPGQLLGSVSGELDFSPILVIAAIIFLQAFLVQSMLELSYRFH